MSKCEVRMLSRTLKILLSAVCGILAATADAAQPELAPFCLWSGEPLPKNPSDIEPLSSICHYTVHRATKDFQHLHGMEIAEHKGILYTAWDHSTVREHDPGGSFQRGRRSKDGGVTWGELETISAGIEGKMPSHGTMFVAGGRLWAFAACFKRFVYEKQGDQSGKAVRVAVYQQLQTLSYRLNEDDGNWEYQGAIIDDFWPEGIPKRMTNGNWIVGGYTGRTQPAVAISAGSDVSRWRCIPIPTPYSMDSNPMHFAETDVWVDGIGVTAVIRNQVQDHSVGCALVATSADGGETWEMARNSNMPMHASRPFCGMLSTGERYLICNIGSRDLLAIAVGDPGSKTLSRIGKIRDEKSPKSRFEFRGFQYQWSYPWAIEYKDRLYVTYSSSKADGMLSMIPLNLLRNERGRSASGGE
jgi:hypothetical protein